MIKKATIMSIVFIVSTGFAAENKSSNPQWMTVAKIGRVAGSSTALGKISSAQLDSCQFRLRIVREDGGVIIKQMSSYFLGADSKQTIYFNEAIPSYGSGPTVSSVTIQIENESVVDAFSSASALDRNNELQMKCN